MGIWIKHFENINLSMSFEWISLRIRTGTWESRPIPSVTETAFSFPESRRKINDNKINNNKYKT